MKKNILLFSAVVLILGVVASEASPQRYHQMLFSGEAQNGQRASDLFTDKEIGVSRHSTSRYKPVSPVVKNNKVQPGHNTVKVSQPYAGAPTGRNFLSSRANQLTNRGQEVDVTMTVRKTFRTGYGVQPSPGAGFTWENVQTVPHGRKLRTFQNKAIALQLPTNMRQTTTDTESVFELGTDLVMVLRYFDNQCQGSQTQACGEALSKHLNYKNEPLPLNDVRIFHRETKDVSFNNVNVRTYVQSFVAEVPNENFSTTSMLVSRYFVPNGNGRVFVLEARTPVKYAGKNLELMKEVFDSFQILAPEQK